MLDDYCIGSLFITYTPSTDTTKPKKGTISLAFTITLSDDLGEEAFFHQVQDTFNPIFLDAEKPNS
jgi:hypothetical protein